MVLVWIDRVKTYGIQSQVLKVGYVTLPNVPVFFGEEVDTIGVQITSIGTGVVINSLDEDVLFGIGVEEFVSFDHDRRKAIIGRMGTRRIVGN